MLALLLSLFFGNEYSYAAKTRAAEQEAAYRCSQGEAEACRR